MTSVKPATLMLLGAVGLAVTAAAIMGLLVLGSVLVAATSAPTVTLVVLWLAIPVTLVLSWGAAVAAVAGHVYSRQPAA